MTKRHSHTCFLMHINESFLIGGGLRVCRFDPMMSLVIIKCFSLFCSKEAPLFPRQNLFSKGEFALQKFLKNGYSAKDRLSHSDVVGKFEKREALGLKPGPSIY